MLKSRQPQWRESMNIMEEQRRVRKSLGVESTEGGRVQPIRSFRQRSSQPIGPEQIRQNFAKTAFFYPTSNERGKGDVFVNFTLPESNTT